MKRVKTDDNARALLTLWEPPMGAGEPRGVLATTFTFEAALFEEECLSRFVGVESDARRDGVLFRLERDGRLSQLIAAVVVADIHHCDGERSLRWDLLAARPQRGILHAKVSLLAWERHVRVLIGSANLTTPGYRQNQECMAILEFTPEQGDQGLLEPLLDYLREVLELAEGPGRARAEQLLAWTRRAIPPSAPPKRGLMRRCLFTGPGRPDFFSQVREMTQNAVWDAAHVVSPFFDDRHRKTGPAAALWQSMKQRGAVEVHFHIAGDELEEPGHWQLQAPEHLVTAVPSTRSNVRQVFHPVPIRAVDTESGPENRELHAKMILLSGPRQLLLSVGSGNFTSAGLGLGTAKNSEAHVVYLLDAPPGDPIRTALERRFLRGDEPIKINDSIEFTPAADDQGEAEEIDAPLPDFFRLALFLGAVEGRWRFRLGVGGGEPPVRWQVRLGQQTLADHQSWKRSGMPEQLECLATGQDGAPSMLLAEWRDGQNQDHVAAWPLQIETADVLPPPPELNGLTLASLLELLGSRRPLHEALRAWLKRQPDDDESAPEFLDPHAKVDTRGFLVQRVRRAGWAMGEIRSRLEQPVASLAGLIWRLEGPVGARAVLEAMERECDPTLPDEMAFLLCEYTQELAAIRLRNAEGKPPSDDVEQRFQTFLEQLRQRTRKAIRKASPAMKAYIQAALNTEAAP